MRYIKNYKKYKESLQIDLQYQNIEDVMESLNIWHDALLSAVDAEELNIFDTLKLPVDEYINKLDIDYLSDNIEFINSLSSLGLKKSEVKNSEDFQTFLNKPCKFMFIYDVNANELQNPDFILFQIWNENIEKWSESKLYKINADIKRFYERLTFRVIEILDGDDNYIYETSNGNEWNLKNIEKENDVYKRVFRKEEMEDLLKNRKVKVNII